MLCSVFGPWKIGSVDSIGECYLLLHAFILAGTFEDAGRCIRCTFCFSFVLGEGRRMAEENV